MMNYVKCNHRSEHIRNAIKYVDDRLTQPISLSDLSDHLHLSKQYTASIFKKGMQKNVTEYINERKMLYAKEMLLNGQFTIAEISANLGYNDYSYFSGVFRKYFSVSSAKFRSEIKG